MRLFQSERRLSRELSRILTSPEDRLQLVERQTLEEEENFLVYLPSDLEVNETSFSHFQLRDGSEIVLQL